MQTRLNNLRPSGAPNDAIFFIKKMQNRFRAGAPQRATKPELRWPSVSWRAFVPPRRGSFSCPTPNPALAPAGLQTGLFRVPPLTRLFANPALAPAGLQTGLFRVPPLTRLFANPALVLAGLQARLLKVPPLRGAFCCPTPIPALVPAGLQTGLLRVPPLTRLFARPSLEDLNARSPIAPWRSCSDYIQTSPLHRFYNEPQRGGPMVAQGKRGTSAALGQSTNKHRPATSSLASPASFPVETLPDPLRSPATFYLRFSTFYLPLTLLHAIAITTNPNGVASC